MAPLKGPYKAALKLALSLAAIGGAAAVFDRLESGQGMRRQLWGLNQREMVEFERKLKARKLPRVDGRFLGAAEDSASPPVDIVPEGGFTEAGTRVSLSAPPGNPIRYTLDGSIPDWRSTEYSGPFAVESSTVVRARVLVRGLLPGPVATRTYFVGAKPSLPVVSVVMDPVNLWNKYTGIYENPQGSGQSWVRQAELERFDTAGRSVWSSSAHIRIHGGYSRMHPKKSFRVTFPSADGDTARHTVILRAGGSNSRFRLRDELFSALYRRSGGVSADFEPVLLRLNARPWGLYDAREYVDQRFLERRFGPGRYELLAYDSRNRNTWATPLVGDDRHWKATLRFFKETPLASPEAYARAGRLLDIPSTIDYWAHNVYAANFDWPFNNMKVFRKADGGRWTWIAWDADASFNYRGGRVEHRTLEWATRDTVWKSLKDEPTFLVSTLPIRRLLENPGFREAFAGRFLDLLNVRFRPDRVEGLLDSIMALSRAELPADMARWGLSDSDYAADQGLLRDFIRRRPAVVRGHLDAYFSLPAGRSLGIAYDTSAGTVAVNGLDLGGSPWDGNYPAGSRLRLAATPRPDHAFAGWRLPGGEREGAALELRLDGDMRVDALFVRDARAAHAPEAAEGRPAMAGSPAAGSYGLFPPGRPD